MRKDARIVDIRDCELKLVGQVGLELDNARELRLDGVRQGFDLVGDDEDVGLRREGADEIRRLRVGLREPDALETLDEQAQRPVGHLEHSLNDRLDTDRVDVVPAGFLGLRALRGDEREPPVAGDNVVDQLDRALLPDSERHHRVGKDDRVLEREEGKLQAIALGSALAAVFACLGRLGDLGAASLFPGARHCFDLSWMGT